jgi:hypothetical protein
VTESGLLSDDGFAEVARRYVAFCHIESKVAGSKNQDLRTQKKLMGLPSLAFLDADGVVLVTVPFDERTVAGVLQYGRRAEEYVRLRTAVAAGDADARAPFLRLQLEEGHLELAAAIATRERIGTIADADLRAAIDAMLVDLRIGTELRAVGQKERYTLGKRFYAILQAGPQPSVRVSRGFHYAMLEWAERERDVVAFGAALADFTRVLAITDPGKPWVEPMLERYRATLAGLEKDRDE